MGSKIPKGRWLVYSHIATCAAAKGTVSSHSSGNALLQPMVWTGSEDSSHCKPWPLCSVFCCVVSNASTFSAVPPLLWRSLPVRWLVLLAQTALLKFTICLFSTLKHLFVIPAYSEMYVNHSHIGFAVVTDVLLKRKTLPFLFLILFLVFIYQLFLTLSLAFHL